MCFGTDAFDTDTFKRAILYQKEGYFILYPLIVLYNYFVCRVNRFRVMVDSVRDPDKFQIRIM